MHDIKRRRRRNQSEIDQLILEFQKSGLSPQAFAQNVGRIKNLRTPNSKYGVRLKVSVR